MANELTIPKTLLEAVKVYSDPKACFDLMVEIRWPKGITCPRCSSDRVTLFANRPMFKCNACKKQFSVKVGTIFEDSPLGLEKWLPTLWLLANCKNGISSCEVARDLGVTQKTAWFMLHRIRHALKQGSIEKMAGTVEADETFVGGLEKNKHEDKKLHAGRGPVGKTIVMGVLERVEEVYPKAEVPAKSKVRAKVVQDTSRKTLHAEIRKEVSAFSELYTDAWKGYRGLTPEYIHKFVDHAVQYALGQVHTNGLENFWALLKRCLKGTYISVEPFHLFRYLDEEVFRFNNRAYCDRDRFMMVLGSVDGKRLTYDTLTRSYEAYYAEIMP